MRKACLLLALPLLAGCVIQSVRPWLPEDEGISRPSIRGVWIGDDATLTCDGGTNGQYRLTLETTSDLETNLFGAVLHRVKGNLLLVAGPPATPPMGDFEAFVYAPAYLLLRVALTNDAMDLFLINVPAFESKLAESALDVAEGGSEENGYLLTSTTAQIERFVDLHVLDEDFFNADPVFSFVRSGSASAPDPN